MNRYYLFLVVFFVGCTEPAPKQPGSIVDSNTINTGDSIPAILHLDDARRDTGFTIALDSIGPTVDAADTARLNKN